MIKRIASVWVAIGAAGSVSFVCYILAGEAGRVIQYRGEALTILSQAFYPDSVLAYLYPLPLVIWALFHTVKGIEDHDTSHLIITIALSITIVFMAVFALALVLPFIPGAPTVLR